MTRHLTRRRAEPATRRDITPYHPRTTWQAA